MLFIRADLSNGLSIIAFSISAICCFYCRSFAGRPAYGLPKGCGRRSFEDILFRIDLSTSCEPSRTLPRICEGDQLPSFKGKYRVARRILRHLSRRMAQQDGDGNFQIERAPNLNGRNLADEGIETIAGSASNSILLFVARGHLNRDAFLVRADNHT